MKNVLLVISQLIVMMNNRPGMLNTHMREMRTSSVRQTTDRVNQQVLIGIFAANTRRAVPTVRIIRTATTADTAARAKTVSSSRGRIAASSRGQLDSVEKLGELAWSRSSQAVTISHEEIPIVRRYSCWCGRGGARRSRVHLDAGEFELESSCQVPHLNSAVRVAREEISTWTRVESRRPFAFVHAERCYGREVDRFYRA